MQVIARLLALLLLLPLLHVRADVGAPRTFQGEPYEEIAVLGGLLLYLCLKVANYYEHSPWIVTVSIVLTVVAVYAARMTVIVFRIRSYRLGDAQGPPRDRRGP